jgi:hypothetical protein
MVPKAKLGSGPPFVCDSFDWVNLVCLLHSACHHACMQAPQMHYLLTSAPYWLLLNLARCCHTLCAPTLIEFETQSVVVQFDNYILIIMFISFQTMHEHSLYNHTSSSIIFQSTPTLTLRHESVHRPRKCSPIAMLSFGKLQANLLIQYKLFIFPMAITQSTVQCSSAKHSNCEVPFNCHLCCAILKCPPPPS